jgi:hypothetical protein
LDRDEIVSAMKMMKEQFSDIEINSIIERLDKDHDGVVQVSDLEKMARELIDLRTSLEEQKKQEKEEIARAKAKETAATLEQKNEKTDSSSTTNQK